MSEKHVFEYDFCGRHLVVEVGELAKQAQGAALIRFDDTAVLSVTCVGKEPTTQDFFPLMVIYQEKLYAAGKIPGGFLRREGRPSEHETLTSRVIDRPIRPLFDENFRNEVQIVNTVLSSNQDNSPEMMSLFGSSLVLGLGGVPFNGPVAGVVVAHVDGKLIAMPTKEELERSDLDLTVAATKYAINMVEAGSKQVSEDLMLEALEFGFNKCKELCAIQEEIIASCGKEKMEIELAKIEDEIREFVTPLSESRINEAIVIEEKLARQNALDQIFDEVALMVEEKYKPLVEDKDELKDKVKQARQVMEELLVKEFRRLITVDHIRPDGRKTDEIRPLDSQVDILERTHGSALFTRGQTQSLAITTLGALGEAQIIDGLNVEDQKRFMLHYNFPAFSVGETGKYGSPGRREIGHGALGERALLQVMPSEDEFPYCVRVVSEILESNGSSSQATICAGCMSLMAAGVPIKAPVAGIAMGLIKEGEHYVILTDIQGMEDHYGDMDFKVAGTKDGITALQMDIKIDGINFEILKEALAQAKKGRLQILENMAGAIKEPRKEVSKYAPKVEVFNINPDKIRDVIGPGGKIITNIIEECDNVKIDIDQKGRVVVMHESYEPLKKAVDMIKEIVREVEVNQKYEGVVTRIEKYGCFVELWPGGPEGLCHISQLDHKKTEKVEDVCKIGDKIEVLVTGIDEKGRVDLSRKALLPKPEKLDEKPKRNKKEKEEDEDVEVVVVRTEINN